MTRGAASPFLTIFAFVLTLAPAAVAQKISPPPDARGSVDKIFARFNRTDSPGCTVGAAIDGATVLNAGYGMADLEHSLAIVCTVDGRADGAARAVGPVEARKDLIHTAPGVRRRADFLRHSGRCQGQNEREDCEEWAGSTTGHEIAPGSAYTRHIAAQQAPIATGPVRKRLKSAVLGRIAKCVVHPPNPTRSL